MNSNWFWLAVAVLLFALEALLPGTFMLWLGFAALGTAIVHLAAPGIDPVGQWFVFALLSLIAVGIGWYLRRRHPPSDSDQPLLNRRAQQLIGRVFALETAIENGRGRIKVADAYWSAVGPTLDAGTRVRVVEVEDGMCLRVVAAD
jgi:membrane protein implicated in regulation of membrane protease activity